MPGQGKYTQYAASATDRNTRLNKLFKGNTSLSNPNAELVGKEEDARLQIIARAQELMSPVVQQGDTGFYPQGVNMHYAGDENGVSAPDMTKVKWDSAGDPANPYTPDITSPGPGVTDGLGKDVDPEISVEDIKGPGYVAGAPGTGTKSPAITGPVVKQNSKLGSQLSLKHDVNGFG